ncbi:hypothetical protein [Pseudorhizobium flavum]|uniref:Uncharacterized protein n=1 Tax=Pseudorhizobium flavum TaxID=1335061 RepID=A0A7W9YWZ1_9HYPH|nr:hypothetical protein [Pseudorhizobium flavum]MBB6179835.1 hypothetical protein [Pseudorhizobium flavum]CAD6597082.1 hypothetical protein RFYW14_00453 [Pseudorhizobium flavum]
MEGIANALQAAAKLEVVTLAEGVELIVERGENGKGDVISAAITTDASPKYLWQKKYRNRKWALKGITRAMDKLGIEMPAAEAAEHSSHAAVNSSKPVVAVAGEVEEAANDSPSLPPSPRGSMWEVIPVAHKHQAKFTRLDLTVTVTVHPQADDAYPVEVQWNGPTLTSSFEDERIAKMEGRKVAEMLLDWAA